MEMKMFGGFMKTTSRLALIAASGMLLGAAMTPAKAADLGGGCCADLEERVAELEATTARKGNRVVSLQVYGQVNKGLLIWDDGIDSDAFVVDNQVSTSRFGFKGKASIQPGWTAGYNMEFELNDNRSDEVTQGKGGDEGNDAAALRIRQNHFYVESDKLGRLTVGHGSTAADGAYEVNLANSGRSSDVNIGNSFSVRTAAGGAFGRLNNWANNLDSTRNDVIRYDSPSVYGFILSASWGDNDYADVALRFKKDFGSMRVAAAVAYQWDNQNVVTTNVLVVPPTILGTTDNNFETFGGSISVMHMPTGLFGVFQAGTREYKNGSTNVVGLTAADQTRADASFWYVQGGIEKKFNSLGATTIYGEYGKYDDFNAWNGANLNVITSSEATRWGLGINQKIDAAAMDIYAHATFWSFDDNTATNYQDMSTVLIGSRIQF